MDTIGGFAQTLTSDKLKAAYAVWNAARTDRVAPRRDEIVPANLRGVLTFTFTMDVVDFGKDFRFRFAGDRISQFMGRRFAGSLLSEQTGSPFFDNMRAMFSACVAARSPIASGVRQATYPGKDFLEVEAMVLPLSDNGVDVTHLFGAFESWQLGTHSSSQHDLSRP
jgi:hypothetical protein